MPNPNAPTWVWICGWSNGAMDWRDSEHCRAASRKPGTKAQAEKGLRDHQGRTGHTGGTIRYLGHKARGW